MLVVTDSYRSHFSRYADRIYGTHIFRSEAACVAEQISSLEYPRKRAVDVAIIVRIGQPSLLWPLLLQTVWQVHLPVVGGGGTHQGEPLRAIEHVGRMGTSPSVKF